MNNLTFIKRLTRQQETSPLKLEDGSRVAVMGGGPAGSLFSYFLLTMAERTGFKIHVDIYEPRNFEVPGPAGCNMCGGVIYESLVQSLAVEGINLPVSVVQRGIEFNMLHMDVGNALIQTPRHEKRIATTFRGMGPRGLMEFKGYSLDGYLLKTAIAKGANHIRARVDEVRWSEDLDASNQNNRLVQVKGQGGSYQTYELLAVTSGVNTSTLKLFRDLDFGYQPPQTAKLLVREYFLGEEAVSKYIGPVFHAFLLNIPGLDYGAIIPKGAYITVCLLSSHGGLDVAKMHTFLNDPAVERILPPDFSQENISCYCGPRINVKGSPQPFGDRIVFIGDSGVSRLYKDGIGAAYRSAKVAASTAVFQGISAKDFKKQYMAFCRKMEFDNRIGKLLFKIVGLFQKTQFARRAVLHMVSEEQQEKVAAGRDMSMVMWDMLTGGAPYKEVLLRALHPAFWMRLLGNMLASLLNSNWTLLDEDMSMLQLDPSTQGILEANTMNMGSLGKIYQNGETIVRQGELGDCMYVIQDGQVEVVSNTGKREVQLAILGKNEFFGEMAIFEHEFRSATVRALGTARILTVDHKNFLRRIHEDPSLAFRLMEVMSSRVRKLGTEVTSLKQDPSAFDLEEFCRLALKP
ncbi:MAG TPA: cyclic nucleotide-binding domain-containing protein [Anaerolineales bacterium]